MTTVARPRMTLRNAVWTLASIAASRALVASSQDQDRRVLRERPGEPKPLALPDLGRVALGMGEDELVRFGKAGGLHQLRIARLRTPDPQVVGDARGHSGP